MNCYATLAQVKADLSLGVNTDHDTELDVAINAASRHIDGYTGWRFWQDASVVDRQYRAEDPRYVCVPEGISTTTGLVVKIDDDGDGTFETTLTINTDFILEPLNAADMVPVWPYTEILLADNYFFPRPYNGRPGVQVTAKFGWSAVPDDVTKACIILAHDFYKARDTPFGVAGDASIGFLRVGQNRTASMLLAPYKKPSIG